MKSRKQAIMAALDAFVNQRPGFDPRNYFTDWRDRAGRAAYRADARKVQQQRRDYHFLAARVLYADTLTADDLLAASRDAFSGRLTIELSGAALPGKPIGDSARSVDIDPGTVRADVAYCTGQYFCTEYRAAACAVLASALWAWTREHAMPAACSDDGEGNVLYPDMSGRTMRDRVLSAGDWLRAHFRREFGRGIASRWFS